MGRAHHAASASSLRERAARLVARPFFLLLVGIARLLPRPALLGLAAACSRAVYWLFPGIRAGLLANAGHILGPGAPPAERAGHARRVLASFARFLAELVSPASRASPAEVFAAMQGREHFEAAAAAGGGVIAVTLHMGNYEAPSMALAALRPDVAIVYNRDPMAFIERVRSRRRQEHRLHEIVIDASMFFGVDVLRRLRAGGIVLLSGDQVAARDGERFPFLHGEAPFSMWPARLSLASGAPLLPAFNVRDGGGRSTLRLEPPIFPDPPRGAEAMTADLVRVFERYVRLHGDQWLMVRPFWIDGAAAPSECAEDAREAVR